MNELEHEYKYEAEIKVPIDFGKIGVVIGEFKENLSEKYENDIQMFLRGGKIEDGHVKEGKWREPMSFKKNVKLIKTAKLASLLII